MQVESNQPHNDWDEVDEDRPRVPNHALADAAEDDNPEASAGAFAEADPDHGGAE